MKKVIRILSILLTLVMLMTSTSAFAYCWECENNIEGTYRNFEYCSDFFGKTALGACGWLPGSLEVRIWKNGDR